MKRKSIILTLCMLLLTSLLAGCGEDGELSEEAVNAIKEQVEQHVTSAPGREQNVTLSPEKQQNITPTPKQEQNSKIPAASTPTEPVLCDRLDDWDSFYQEYGSYYSAVQIEDMFFYPGMMGSELGEVVANSEDKEIEAVVMTKLMEADAEEEIYATQCITYYRGEEAWFDVYVRNTAGALQPLGECIVTLVLPCEAALEYCRFFDGTYTVEALKKITYKEYDAFAEKLSGYGYSVSQSGSYWSVKSKDDFSPASLEESIYWTKQKMVVDLLVNLDTGMIESVEPTALRASTCEVYVRHIPEDFDWSNEEFKESLLDFYVQEKAFRLDEFKEPEVVSVFKDEDEGCYCVVFRDKSVSEDGTYTYRVCGGGMNVGIDVLNHAAELVVDIPWGVLRCVSRDATLYVDAVNLVYNSFGGTEQIYLYQEDVDWCVSEYYDFANETCREQLKNLYEEVEGEIGLFRHSRTLLGATEGEEVVAVYKGQDVVDICTVLRCVNPEAEGEYFYRVVEFGPGEVVVTPEGNLILRNVSYSYTGADAECYVEVVGKLYEEVENAALLYQYDENVDFYATNPTDISDELYNEVNALVQSGFASHVENTWDDVTEFYGMELVDYYFLYAKDQTLSDENKNYVGFVYKVTAYDHLTGGQFDYYWFCEFGNVIVMPEGSLRYEEFVKNTDWDRDDTFSHGDYIYIGYPTLEELWDIAVASNLEKYDKLK